MDCLLQRGAQRVYAVDPGYGVLDYKLRQDARVVVFERTNALEFACPEPCGLVTVDVGWTPQRVILPAVGRCLAGGPGRVVTLIKPHYEAPKEWLRKGVVMPEHLDETLAQCRQDVRQLGWLIVDELESPSKGMAGTRSTCGCWHSPLSEGCYCPVKRGLRLLRNASTPSRWSALRPAAACRDAS